MRYRNLVAFFSVIMLTTPFALPTTLTHENVSYAQADKNPSSPSNLSIAQTTTLQQADHALFNGDYDKARELYTQASTNAQTKCQGLLGVGTTDLRANLLDVAETTLSLVITQCQPTNRAYLLRAEARRLAKKDKLALEDYTAAIKAKPGLIDSYIYERMAGMGGDDGLKFLRLAAEAPRAGVSQLALYQRLLQIYKALNDTPNMLKQYENILATSQEPKELAETEVALADIEIANNQAAMAYERLQRVIAKFPETEPAFSALVTLVSAGQPVDLVVRTRINIKNENYLPVISRVTRFIADNPIEKVPAELYLLLGKAHRGLGNTMQALGAFQKARDLYPNDPAASAAALEQAETYLAQNDQENALKGYLEIETAYPNAPEAPEALLRAAALQQKAGHTEESLALYERLGTKYPQSEQAKQGSFTAGSSLVKTDPSRAARFFGYANNAQGLLWQGKMLAQLGNWQAAHRAWQAALEKDPGSFFSLRAQDLLNQATVYQPPTDVKIIQNSPQDKAAAEKWLGQTFKLPTFASELSPELARDPRLLRGTELWALGWWQEASAEFDALHQSVREDKPSSLYQLAHYYKQLGVYRSSLISATRLIVLTNLPHSQVPAYLGRLAYPLDYDDLVLPAAQANKLDPLYVATLIRTESNFDSTAFSSAEARGLMQITEVTGQEIADQLKVENFDKNWLYRPTVSIRFGTTYLNSLKQGLNNNAALALVAYNAGPGYASGLLQQFGGDIDTLYLSIDVEEPRNYIEFTYQTYAMYRILYGIDQF